MTKNIIKKILIGGLLIAGVQNVHSMDNQTLAIPTKLRTLVEDEAKEYNMPAPQIILNPLIQGTQSIVSKNVIIFGDDAFIICVKAGIIPSLFLTPTNNIDQEKFIHQLKGVVGHELGHIKNNDERKLRFMLFLSLATPFVSGTLLANHLKKLNKHPLAIAGICCLNTASQYGISRIMSKAVSRNFEYWADEHVKNDIDTLEGIRDSFIYMSSIKQTSAEPVTVWEKIKDYAHYLWNGTHPSTQSRINRFQERIDALKEQQEKL